MNKFCSFRPFWVSSVQRISTCIHEVIVCALCVCVWVCVCECVSVCVCMCLCVRACVCACMRACVPACVCVCLRACVCLCASLVPRPSYLRGWETKAWYTLFAHAREINMQFPEMMSCCLSDDVHAVRYCIQQLLLELSCGFRKFLNLPNLQKYHGGHPSYQPVHA